MTVIGANTLLAAQGGKTTGMLMAPGGPSSVVTNDFAGSQGVNYQGAVWGSVIPLSAGYRKVAGAVIWAGPLVKTDVQTATLTFGLQNEDKTDYTSWRVKRTFAVSLGARLNPAAPPPKVRRVWADGALVWADGEGIPLTYLNINEDYLPTGQFVNGIWVPLDPNNPTSGPDYFHKQSAIKSNLTFRFYDGNEEQMPDEAIVADLGELATAFRGQMYMVIEGLVVGKGFSQKYTINGPMNGDPNIDEQNTIPPAYPAMTVELTDGTESSAVDHAFTMLEDATPLVIQDHVLLANWDTRELAIIDPQSSGGFLNLFDMDSTTQTACIPIGAGDAIGPSRGFAVWDKLNDIFYTEREGNHCICSVSKGGSLISTALIIGVNLFPFNADNTTITDDKPAIAFPRPNYGDVGYVLQGGSLQPIVLAGREWIAAFCPTPSGSLPGSLRPRQFYEMSSTLQTLQAFPLHILALHKKHLSYQDAAFVVANRDVVQIVYVTYDDADSSSNIIGRTTIHTASLGSGTFLAAVLDKDGNVVVNEYKVGSDTILTKIGIEFADTADLDAVPGWRGLFPQVTGIRFQINPADTGGTWEANNLRESDVRGGTVSPFFGGIVSLTDGTILNPAGGFGGFDSSTSVWDSQNNARFYHGDINTNDPPQPFQGHGVRWAQVFTGVNGNVDTVGDVVRELAHAAGYGDSDLDIDSGMTDPVPGVLILQPYDLTTLFNDIGAIYEFTYFNSGGRLKFARASNSPTKATGGWNITGTTVSDVTVTVQDGDTATIGSFTYRFKLVPSAPFDVKICTDTGAGTTQVALDAAEKTASNFLAAIMGDLSLAAVDSQTDGFYPGTVKNTLVNAKAAVPSANNFGFASISLTALVGGVVGNSITTTATGTHMSFDHGTLTNGAEPPEADVVITLDQLAPVQSSQITETDALVTTIAPFGQGQQAAAIGYYALEQDYVPSQQTFIPDNQNGAISDTGNTTVQYNLPFVMSTSEAYARVARTAIRVSDNVVIQEFRLPQAFLLTEPSDVISIQIPPFNYTVRVDEATFNGDYSTSFSAMNYTYRSDVEINDSDSTSRLPQTIPSASDCQPVVIDAPLLNPAYGTVAGNVDLWDGVRAYVSGFEQATLSAGKVQEPLALAQLFTVERDVKWGTVVGNMPTAAEPFYRTVEDTITINCKTIDPTSDLLTASYQDFVAGKNCVAIGRPGSWEYVFFRDVEVVNAKIVKLTGLVRAQRGTDAAVGSHDDRDIVLLLASVSPTFQDQMLLPQALDTSEVGTIYQFHAVGQPSSKATVDVNIDISGFVLYPFSPCHLKAELVAGNDLDLSWVRRDRLGTEFVTNDQRLSETTERYDVEIMSGLSIVRTLADLTSPAYTYTSAQQTTDGFAPPLASLEFRVYQKGELGRGFPRTETVNVE